MLKKAVEEIRQIYSGGNEPDILKWNGMLDLIKGETDSATRKLYSAYEELRAAGRRDMFLSYVLGRLFRNSNELGAAAEFYGSAISLNNRSVMDKIDDLQPESLLDYADILFKLQVYDGTLNFANYFEKKYWSNDRSKRLRIRALIGLNQLDEVQEMIANTSTSNDPNIIGLNFNLMNARARQVLMTIARKRKAQETNLEISGIKNRAR